MGAVRAEDHQVRNVHDADAQCRNLLAQERRGGDDLERHFHADADEDDVRRHAFVGGGELPDRRAGDAVL